jgi:hypothetical protein
MVKTIPDAYRVSVVYYALRGLKDCHTFAEETARAAVRRTERETKLGSKESILDGIGQPMLGKRNSGVPRVNPTTRTPQR